ncbi:hypothetical protein IV203_030523 [Nitzschia inconspicua]|uniref:RPA43 OB domain-containing protein n=1 Tax=Nitzschia inconspicua TaxID=303405 RepID=A0A9K3Q268_9STRA|nr:hypothetical protein IV203_030523 [Nitzschia inconspicua]
MGKRKERHPVENDVESNAKKRKKDKRKKKSKDNKDNSSNIQQQQQQQQQETVVKLELHPQQEELQEEQEKKKKKKKKRSTAAKSNTSSRPRTESFGSISLSYGDLVASQDTRNNDDDDDDDNRTYPTTFFQKRVQLTISLLPYSLRNMQGSIRASLRKRLLQYSDGWGGILLAFDNITFRNTDNNNNNNNKGRGWILNELPHIHYEIECDVLVFAPTVGCQLQGTVSECFPSHISILVFGYINAMVSADTLLKTGLRYDHESHTWTVAQEGNFHINNKKNNTDDDYDLNNTNNNNKMNNPHNLQCISKGDKIKFVVSKIHECDGTLSLEGKSPVSSLLVES